MINECSIYCEKYCLSFNNKKSKVMVFSKSKIDKSIIQPLTVGGGNIDFVDSIKYLGTHINSDPSLSFSHEEDLRSFYRASNSVLNQLHSPDETVLMHLLYAHCVPCFTYASAVKDYSGRQMTECTVALNDAIRKIFTFHRWESVRVLREGFGYSALCDIFAKAKKKFDLSLPRHANATVWRLGSVITTSTQ